MIDIFRDSMRFTEEERSSSLYEELIGTPDHNAPKSPTPAAKSSTSNLAADPRSVSSETLAAQTIMVEAYSAAVEDQTRSAYASSAAAILRNAGVKLPL